MSKLGKTFIFALSLLMLAIMAKEIAFAGTFLNFQQQTSTQNSFPETADQAVKEDESVSAKDLNVLTPFILPDSPFYFLKDWARKIHLALTFSPLQKAKLHLKYASERLVEIQQLVLEKNANSKTVAKATKEYKKEITGLEESADKIKAKTKESPEVKSFLDKFIKQEVLCDKILEKLETTVPKDAFEKIKEARKLHLKNFALVMEKLEDKNKIPKTLEKDLNSLNGSKFKQFKNLEILRLVEENAPKKAKEAIKRARENIAGKLSGTINRMSQEKQEEFKNYIEKINGTAPAKISALEDIRMKFPERSKTRQMLTQTREKILANVSKMQKIMNCPPVRKPASNFCLNGRVVPQENSKGCITNFKCLENK